jgi:hypothetical protein
VNANAGAGFQDLLRNYRLLVADRGHHERHGVRESFAHRVVTPVANHYIKVWHQVEQGNEPAYQDVVGYRTNQLGGRHQDRLQSVGERRHRINCGGEKPSACLGADSAK